MLMQSKTARERGETLIELLLAFAILSMALVTVMRTMNGGLDSLFVNGQRSQVEAQMRGQLAVLQAAHQQAIKDPSAADWAEITSKIADTVTSQEQSVDANGCSYTANKNRLFFPTNDATSWTSEVDTKSGGAVAPIGETPVPDGTSMWIEAKHTPKDETTFTRGFYDFYIKSCWQGGGDVEQEAKMVTRLYDIQATTAKPLYNNLILNAYPIACANGSSGKMGYSIKNENSYPFGEITVTINPGNRSYSYPNLAPGSTITNDTPAGFPAGDYTVRATVVSTGDFKEVVPVRVLVCPPAPITIPGSNHTACAPLFDLERDERVVSRPTYGFLSNSGPYPYPCMISTSGGNSSVYACVNYDARYSPGVTLTGSYKMTLRYFDAKCDSGDDDNIQSFGYTYRVDIFKNGNYLDTMILSPGDPIMSSTYTFSTLSPGDNIGIRWWNNRFIGPSQQRDPDFLITSIRLEWN